MPRSGPDYFRHAPGGIKPPASTPRPNVTPGGHTIVRSGQIPVREGADRRQQANAEIKAEDLRSKSQLIQAFAAETGWPTLALDSQGSTRVVTFCVEQNYTLRPENYQRCDELINQWLSENPDAQVTDIKDNVIVVPNAGEGRTVYLSRTVIYGRVSQP